ncbi:zinc finger, CCHC-type containing protein [Tanacetum coccineum]|uniref:Zinc finger, CCHC-type containing protein n=1 Tax=Tanacetum coccineum TaxID=301880 RepID=A0ABQ4XYM1_9ASTR
MATAAMKYMTSNFSKLDKFEGVDFRRWENATMEQIGKRNKWDNNEYVCRGLILNVMEQYNELLGILESFIQHKMNMDEAIQCGKSGHLKKVCKGGKVGNKSNGSGINGLVDASTNSLKGETVHVCKDRYWFKTYESLNHGSILHMRYESTGLVHGLGCVDLRFSSRKIISLLNIVNDNIGSTFMSTSKLNDLILWHARRGHVHYKRMQDMSKDELILSFEMDTEKCKTCMLTKITKKPFQNVKRETEVLELIHSDLCDLYATPSLENKKYFVTFIDYASRFCYVYLLHTNDEALDNSRTESWIPNGIEDIGGLVVPEEVVVQQPESELRKSKRNRTLKNFGPEFQLYLIEDTRGEVFDPHSYFFNVEDNPKTFDEAMKSQDVTFWKEAINDEMDSIMGNNTWVLADVPPGCKPFSYKWFFKRKLKVDGTIKSKFDESGKGVVICLYVDDMLIFGTDKVQVELTKEFLSSRFSMKDMKD